MSIEISPATFTDQISLDLAPLKLWGPRRCDSFQSLKGLTRIVEDMAYPLKTGDDMILTDRGAFALRITPTFRFMDRAMEKRKHLEEARLLRSDALMIGDSFFELWEQNYPDSYRNLLPGVTKANAGLCMTTTQDWRQCLKLIASDMHPKFVLVNIGINNMDDIGEPGDCAYLSWRSLMLDLRERFKTAAILVDTITHCSGTFSVREPEYALFNHLVKGFVERSEGFYLVDAARAFGLDDANLQCDGLHPNEAGYAILSSLIEEALERSRI